MFGVGLVGAAIVKALQRDATDTQSNLPLSWSSPAQRSDDLARIAALVLESGQGTLEQLDIVWAAGRAGFGASWAELEPETQALNDILRWSRSLAELLPSARVVFHLLSSAGGLFEGQRFVEAGTAPRPQRPYGEAKLTQEAALAALLPGLTAHVYRPSSVYGFGVDGGRAGLLSTLIENSRTGRATRIFGGMDTVRDYVLSSDIGAFIARKIVAHDEQPQTYLLANGKATSICEMLQLVRKVVGRPLNLKLDVQPSNASHITFRQGALPEGWRPTDLETGIRLVARRLSQRFETGAF
jgi:nucleoside-diphosphate-sugar epimerase